MTGILTKNWYNYAAVYNHQYSGLGYTYIQKSSDGDETIQSKKAFGAYCNQRGLGVKAYYANNGIFMENK